MRHRPPRGASCSARALPSQGLWAPWLWEPILPWCPQPADTFILSLTAWSIPGLFWIPDEMSFLVPVYIVLGLGGVPLDTWPQRSLPSHVFHLLLQWIYLPAWNVLTFPFLWLGFASREQSYGVWWRQRCYISNKHLTRFGHLDYLVRSVFRTGNTKLQNLLIQTFLSLSS